jgi:hypothetical protein
MPLQGSARSLLDADTSATFWFISLKVVLSNRILGHATFLINELFALISHIDFVSDRS